MSSSVSLRGHASPADRPLRRLTRWMGPHRTLLLTGVVGVAVLWLFTWLAGEIYESVQRNGGLAGLDHPVLDWMIAHRTPALDHAITAFTTVGGPVVTPIVAGLVVLWQAWHWRSWLPILLMGAGTAGSLAVTIAGKNYVGRVRPPHELAVPPYEFSPSFPSGHSLNSVVIGGIIAYLLWRHLRRRWARWTVAIVTAVYALLMGLSRVYLGHHWLSDVLVGWALGAAWLAVLITVHSLAVEIKEQRAAERELAVRHSPAVAA